MTAIYGGSPAGLSGSYFGGHRLGVLAEAVPASGASGPGYLFPALSLPADIGKRVRGAITRWPTLGTLDVAGDSAFSYLGATDHFEWRLYVDGAASATDIGYGAGISRVALQVGAGAVTELAGAISLGGATPAGYVSIGGGLLVGLLPGYTCVLEPRRTTISVRRDKATMGTTTNPGFSPKAPGESLVIGFDFSKLTVAATLVSFTIARHAGAADADPGSMLIGAPETIGGVVGRRVSGGVDGTDYHLLCTIDAADGNRYIGSGVLPVRAP